MIREMTTRLKHRGPDEEGYFVDGNIALGHRRLSIIDLAGGRQPIFNENGDMVIVFNGEVFNFREIRERLEKEGHSFATNSDTETIIHAYEQWGADCLHMLRGMFAFAIWDARKKELFIARDRLGIKPLFYAQYAGKFVFSSEMKSILADAGFRREIDEEALCSYFIYSYIPAPQTIYSNIRKLLPGHYIVLKDGRVRIEKYWDIRFEPDRKKKEKQIISELMDLIGESVRIRLISEVPLGAFLSGGVDSGMVVALMSGQAGPVRTFTIGFGGNTGSFDDERKYARLVSDRYRTSHAEYEVRPEIEGVLDEIVSSFDEPFADDGAIPSYYVCKAAREHVTVALSGLGGDEALAGYERYLGYDISLMYERVPRLLRRGVIERIVNMIPENRSGGNRINHIKRFARSSSGSDQALRYFGFVSRLNGKNSRSFFRPVAINGAMDSARENFIRLFNDANADEPLNRIFYWDIKTYLPEDILACTDRMSMRHSLEVRVPFLDHELMEYCATIPPELKMRHFQKKYLLKRAAARFLPAPVINHKKQGFTGPMSHWLRTDLKALVGRKLSRENIGRHGLFEYDTVERIVSDHINGRETNDALIWSMLVFQSWFEWYMDPK